jgi:hypothetical protein
MLKKIIFIPKTKYTHSYAPLPEPATKNIPEWYKNEPKYIDDSVDIQKNGMPNLSIKKCMPVFDAMTAGYILKFPADLFIDATGQRLVYTQSNQFDSALVTTNHPDQVKNIPFNRNFYMDEIIKIHPQWMIKTEEGYSSIFLHPMFNEDLKFKAISGVVDTDNFISDGGFSILIERGFKGVIKRGTPLIQVIPFKREDYAIEVASFEEYEDEVLENIMNVRCQFEGGYKDRARQKKNYK